jgi:hypothetical protein
MIHAESTPPDTTQMVFQKDEILCPYPLPQPPRWMPPLALRDAAELEQQIFEFTYICLVANEWKLAWPYFYNLIARIWRKRLPVSGPEVWQLASLHGLPSSWKPDIETIFEHGREILIMAEGRRPIKKKRVHAFTI